MLLPSDIDAQNQIKDQLLEGEDILWLGRPQPGIKFTKKDIINIPATILWCGFGFFILSDHMPSLVFVIFVLAGIYFTIGRFFFDRWKRSKTFYAITSNRVIIKSGIIDSVITSFDVATLADLDLSERSDGSGTIKLDSESPLAGIIIGRPRFGADEAPALEYIADARNVYDLILQLKHKKRYQL